MDRVVTTIIAMMIYIAFFQTRLLHTRLFIKIRSRKRHIDILVNMRESMERTTAMVSNFEAKKVCSGDK